MYLCETRNVRPEDSSGRTLETTRLRPNDSSNDHVVGRDPGAHLIEQPVPRVTAIVGFGPARASASAGAAPARTSSSACCAQGTGVRSSARRAPLSKPPWYCSTRFESSTNVWGVYCALKRAAIVLSRFSRIGKGCLAVYSRSSASV